ncbi:hypothetical protein [uncultured Methanobrevibacter sp.]|nr:hypothetical protein [uncultured Methanobrevibacter sp.]
MSFFDSPASNVEAVASAHPRIIQRILNMAFIRCNALNKSLILIG